MSELTELRRLAAGVLPGEARTLRYGDCVVRVASPADGFARRLSEQLVPYFDEAPDDGTPVSVQVFAVPRTVELPAARALGTKVVIDASLYPTNTVGWRLDEDGQHAVTVEKTGTVCLFLPDDGVAYVFNGDLDGLRLDTERLVKGLVTVAAERAGEVVLHASGVVTEQGTAVLMPGDSRNGKTTVLLHALTHFSVDMLSCDTSFLRRDGEELRARGWPSNFSVSTGTLHDFAGLHALMTPRQRRLSYRDAWAIYPKEVLSTPDVLEQLGTRVVPRARIGAVVFLNFDCAATTGITPVDDPAVVRAWLRQVCLGSRDPLYPNWHGFWTASEDEIERQIEELSDWITEALPVHQLDWAPGPDQLLRHVDLLDDVSTLRHGTR